MEGTQEVLNKNNKIDLTDLGIGIVVLDIVVNMGNYNKQILELLNKKEMNISELQRELKISYKETHRHTKDLINISLIHAVKKSNEKHQPRILSITLYGKEILKKSYHKQNLILGKIETQEPKQEPKQPKTFLSKIKF